MKEAYKQKQIIIDEIKDKFERAESAVVIDYMGITVAEADETDEGLSLGAAYLLCLGASS